MNTLYHAVLAAMSITLFLVGSAEARTVYLKDGALLQADAVRHSGGKVIVLVNHEAEVTFAEGEVNLRKTFPHRAVRKKSSPRVKQAVKAPVMAGMTSARAPVSGQIPASKPVPSAKNDSAGPAGAAPSAAQTPTAGNPSSPAPVKKKALSQPPPR